MSAPARGRYDGMRQILHYNKRFYLLAGFAATLATAALLLQNPPAWLTVLLVGFVAATALGSASSLLVSHYIYDRSHLFAWDWLRLRVDPPARWVVLHAGLDEASPGLRRLFPAASADVLDVYDPNEMPEPSIAVARRLTPLPEPARRASAAALPLDDSAIDLALLFFVAHELRRPAARERLFHELRRVLRPGGRLGLVEHLRDWPNVLAFGPGALHFFPRREWLRLVALAGLRTVDECRLTPFVRAFFLERS
jgi:SAM-dependent methyltransferase